jgi:hypothetical protein
MLINPNGILLFSVQFGFNGPMGKFEHLNGFKKIVWVPGMARDQKNCQKVPKVSQYSKFRGKNVKI